MLVMLIDDERMDQMIYTRVLKRSELVDKTIGFPTGMSALEYLRDKSNPRPDVIFLDINMPRMNGFQFLDAATNEFGDDFAKAVVIMLTTSLDPSDMQRAAQYSAVKEFVNKPLSIELLMELKKYFT